jgi:hypothetical protein
MSIWRWVQEYRQQAEKNRDAQRVHLSTLLARTPPFERDPDLALNIIEEGRRLAGALQEPRWELFYIHWKLQVLLYYKGDYRDVLEEAAEAAVAVSKPQFADFPQRVCLQEDLITAYLKIDPLGYEDQIEEALRYMQREVSPDMECKHCVLSCRSEFEFACDRLQDARTSANAGLDLAQSDHSEHQLTHAYANLCKSALALGDYDNLAGWAEAGEEMARRIDRKLLLAQFLMWQAVTRRRAGDTAAASRFFRAGLAQARLVSAQLEEGFYAGLCAYHEIGGELDKALQARDRQREGIKDKGQLDQECRVQMERCRLLTLLGRCLEGDLEVARQAARKLKKPEKYLARIEELTSRG